MYPPPDGQTPGNQSATSPRYVMLRIPRVTPVVTYVLMGITIAVYLLQVLSQNIYGVDIVANMGLKANEQIISGQFWRLFTPMFLHGSPLHIIFNMYALFVLGPSLEGYYGHGRYLTLYILSGFAGNVISFLFSSVPSLGASTAIFGLIGAEAVFLFRNRRILGSGAQRALSNVIFIIVINLMFGGFSAGIDNWGHMGGLLGGTFFAWYAGPLFRVEGGTLDPHLVDDRDPARALIIGVLDFAIFAALALMKVLRGY
jgi:rhomboid protease GluP